MGVVLLRRSLQHYGKLSKGQRVKVHAVAMKDALGYLPRTVRGCLRGGSTMRFPLVFRWLLFHVHVELHARACVARASQAP